MNPGFVVLMGLSIVFIGLICIIVVCKLMSLAVGIGGKSSDSSEKAAAPIQQQASQPTAAIPSRPELAAAMAAAISEYSGKDISGIRILSSKKL